VKPNSGTAVAVAVTIFAIAIGGRVIARPRLDAVEKRRLAVHDVRFEMVGDSAGISADEALHSARRWFFGRVVSAPVLGLVDSPQWPHARVQVPLPDRYLDLQGRLVYAVHLRSAQPKFGPVVYRHHDVVVLIDAHTGRWIREV
jgi:hypothetical protein